MYCIYQTFIESIKGKWDLSFQKQEECYYNLTYIYLYFVNSASNAANALSDRVRSPPTF